MHNKTYDNNMRYLPFFLLILVGCSSPVLDETYSFDNQEWTYSDTLDFSFEIEDTAQLYDMYLEIEHSSKSPHQNIYYQVTYFANDEQVQQHILSFDFFTKKGYSLGDCNNETCTVRSPFSINTEFDKSGVYKLRFVQYTRNNSLMGIHNFNLTINKKERS